MLCQLCARLLLRWKLCLHKKSVSKIKASSRIDLIEDVGRKTGKQSNVFLGSLMAAKVKSVKQQRHARINGTGLKQVEKLKRVDCIEAERIIYIVEHFLAHLLLIGGLQASLVSEVKDFPATVIELKKTIISPTPDVERICALTRDCLRILGGRPELCARLRSHSYRLH